MKKFNFLFVCAVSVLFWSVSAQAQVRFGDNLGNHQATKDLDMKTFNVKNIGILGYNSIATISNVSGGGNIGTAATTVDKYTIFPVNQTSTGQALTLPTPGDGAIGHVAYIKNAGTASFTMYGVTVAIGGMVQLTYDGAAWSVTSAGTAVSVLGTPTGSNANGGVIAGNTLSLSFADGTNPGLVSTGTQTFAGDKTLSGATTFTGNVSQTGSTTFSTGTGTVLLNGDVSLAAGKSLAYASGAGNFDQSLSTGTFKTGTGAVSLNGITTLNGNTTLSSGKSFSFTDGTTNTITLSSPTSVTSYALTLPTAAAAFNGQMLSSTTAGALSWVTVTPVDAGTVSNNTLRWDNTAKKWVESSALTNDATNIATTGNLSIGGATTSTGNLTVGSNKFTVTAASGNTLVAGTLGVTGATTLSNTLGVSGATTLSSTLAVTGTTALGDNTTLANGKSLIFTGNSKTVTLTPSASTANAYTLTLPTDKGTANQVLTATDAAGTLGWATPTKLTKTLIAMGSGASAHLANDGSSNNSYTYTFTVTGVLADDAVIVNFAAADYTTTGWLNPGVNDGIVIMSAVATAINTVKVTLANMEAGTTPSIDALQLSIAYGR